MREGVQEMKFGSVLRALLLMSMIPILARGEPVASRIEEQGSARYVRVEGLAVKQRDGLLRVQLSLRNSDNEARQVYWRVKWLDEDGFQVWEDEAWKPVLVQGSARLELGSLAPTPKARDFRIQLNAADNTANKPGEFQTPGPASTN